MCGLCLPHCPTYRVTGDENESPRGRIALMRALSQGDLPLDEPLEQHVSQCTACGACERVCPSYVGYTKILYATRAAIAARHHGTRRWGQAFMLNGLFTHAYGLWVLKILLRAYQRSGLQKLLRRSRLRIPLRLARWENLLPTPPSNSQTFTQASTRAKPTRGKVALFTGCVASVVDSHTLRATINVLEHLGYEVVQPKNQVCCGALSAHAGDMAKATTLMRRNLHAFEDPALQAIVSVASGCTALLAQYPQHLADPQAVTFSSRIRDINRFLVESPWPTDLHLKPLAKTIAVHEPCTLRNVLRGQDHPYTLLRRLPQAQIIPLAENQFCCGGAGAYMLTQSAMADRLRDDKMAHLQQLAPDLLATSNIGCALHMAAGLRAQGISIEVVHPVTLIARQWPD